ncbi:Low temperature requirement A [Penicillium roqueforti FM164]|uniref:Low temperature requirement A n=1 Tax=Penicillium roqueforti (strain FM164) TaxID=1365484 RepID=W6QPE6_PENRF|nr:Low temperature requirement A [Penicillium roqueforti FM164]
MSASTPEEPQSNPRFLFHQPRALQWFEDGKLMRRQDGERQAGRFELFLDLLYVAILSNFADTLAEDISGAKLVKYILILAPSWNVWSDLRELMNAFYTDDLLQRILILWVMAVLVVYGNNAPLVDEEIGAMRSAVGSYMVARISCNLAHVFYSFASYHHRPQQRLWVVLSSLSLCIYIPLYFESVSIRGKIAAAAVAISVETMVWILCYSPAGKKLLRVRWSTAVDIAHEIDRFSAFYIIALGEFLYLIIVGSYAAVGLNKRLLRAVWTLVIAFCLNWLYAHADGSLNTTHPCGTRLLAGGHVAAQSVAEKEFEAPQRWLLCGGLGAGMIFLYVFALLHKSNDESGTLILDKPFRLIMRPAVGIITILLPLADHLNATDVLSIIMALFVFTLIWETITSLKKGACFWETWTDTDYPEDKPEVHNAKNEGTV